MATTPFKAIFAAGGTGGHLFPALAVAEELHRATGGNCSSEFIGTADRIEATIVPQYHYNFHAIPIAGLQKLLSLNTLKLPFKILRSIAISRSILKDFRPQCVICTGAYLSYPVGIAASQLGIPLFLMESNAYPGKTVRQLAPRATRIYATFEEARRYFSPSVQSKIDVTGNPIRAALDADALPDKREARQIFGLEHEKPTVFVFGGSLGARSINQAVEQSLPQFRKAGIQVLWQTGKNFQPTADTSGVARVLQFVDNMAAAYAAADVVVCRAGATTIAELSCAKKLSILVPFPLAANDHQTTNALALQKQGAAMLLRDSDVSARLFERVRDLLDSPKQQHIMAQALSTFAKPHAAQDIVASIFTATRFSV